MTMTVKCFRSIFAKHVVKNNQYIVQMLPEAAISKLAKKFKLYEMIALLLSYW